jgi:serine/threonine protein kinase
MSTSPAPKPVDSLVGRTLAGRFKISAKLAAGGMGVVYKAEQLPLGRQVALKVLESKHIPDMDESFRHRFFLEAAAASKLSHPNTIVVYDYGQGEEGIYFIAMEYLAGMTLERHLKTKGPLEPKSAIHVGLQVASSLRDAHEQGLVHRDLKPGNIMFAPRGGDQFFVKVLDFGLVKVVSGEEKEDLGLTRSGVVMGSPRYMAPEQVRTLPVDHRTDIYSFGATLYHALTGAPPFSGGKAFDAMTAHVTTPPPAFKTTWPDCPASPRLEAAIMKCLEKKPEARFQTMEELMIELHSCMNEALGNISSGSSYLAGASIPGLQIIAEKSDSNPSIQAKRIDGLTSSPNLAAGSPSGAFSAIRALEGPLPIVSPPKPSPLKWIVLGGALILTAGVIGTVVALLPGDEPETTTVQAQPSEPADDEEPEVTAPAVSPVAVVSEPVGAAVRHDGRDLGDTPLQVPVPTGEQWELELTMEGYEPRRVTVLAGQPQMMVRLRRVAAAAVVAEQPAPAGGPLARRRAPGPAGAQTAADPEASPPPRRQAGGGNNANADIHDPWNDEE